MLKLTLVFAGSVREPRGAGFGSFAVVKDSHSTLTHLELGDGMTVHEAAYDTLLTALETISRQERLSEVELEIISSDSLIAKQLKGLWQAREHRMRQRLSRVRELLKGFHHWDITAASHDQVARWLRY
jgi:ribonuclease HI